MEQLITRFPARRFARVVIFYFYDKQVSRAVATNVVILVATFRQIRRDAVSPRKEKSDYVHTHRIDQ